MNCNCKNCGASFECVKRGNNQKKYCSTSCRREYWKRQESNSKPMAAYGGGGSSVKGIDQEIGNSLLNRGLKPVVNGLAAASGLGIAGVIGSGIIADVATPKLKQGITDGTIKPIGTFGGAATGYYFSRNQHWAVKLLSVVLCGYLGNKTNHVISARNNSKPMAAYGGGGGGENGNGRLTDLMMEKMKQHKPFGGEKTAADILNTKYKSYNMKDDYFGLVFGYKPADPFHAIAYGKAGSGKSTISMQYANYFANNFGKVKFLSSEMKEGDGLKSLLIRTNTSGNNIVFDTAPSNITLEQHIERLKAADVRLLIIDSANHLKWSPEDLEEIKKAIPRLSTFVILQSVKQGDFRGHNDYVHNADVVLKIQAFEVYTEKSRFDKEPVASVAINL